MLLPVLDLLLPVSGTRLLKGSLSLLDALMVVIFCSLGACEAASQLVIVWFWATLLGTFYCAVYIVLPALFRHSKPDLGCPVKSSILTMLVV